MSYFTILAYCAQLEKTQTLAHIFTRYINKVIHTILRTESGFHHIITNNNNKKRGQLARLVLGLYDTSLFTLVEEENEMGPNCKIQELRVDICHSG